MPRELLIVGTGGLAKEAAQLARRIDPSADRWSDILYVTERREQLGAALPFGTVRLLDVDLASYPGPADAVIGIGDPRVRQRIGAQLRSIPHLSVPNLVHPAVELDRQRVRLGQGNMICQGVVLTCDIELGDFNLLNWNATVGHDVRIGSFNVINPSSNLSGHVTIGDSCLIGAASTVLERLTVASGVTVGAGAVVTRSIELPGVYLGVPARGRP